MTVRSAADHWLQLRAWRHLTAGDVGMASLAVLLAGMLFRLATTSGGRELESLTLAQTVIFAGVAVTAALGSLRRGAGVNALGGVIAAIALTSLWTIRPESSLRQLLLWLTYFGVAVILASSLRNAVTARRFLDAIVVTGGVVSLFGLYLFWGADDPGMRLYATFYAPNTFAAFLLLVLPLTLVRLACAPRPREAFDYGFVAVLLATSLQLTSSRGAWLALAAAAPLALLVLRPPSWPVAARRLLVAAVCTAAAVALLTHAPWSAVGRANQLLTGGNRSVGDRLGYWISALEIFRDHPIVGTGAGTFGFVHPQYQRSILVYSQDAHNLYAQTAAEMGIVGFLALGVLLVSIAGLWLRVLRQFNRGEEHTLVAGIGLSLAAFFLHSGVEMNFAFPANPAMAFALVGILEAYGHFGTSRVATVAPRKAVTRWWRYGVTALMSMAIATVQVQQVAERNFDEGRRLVSAGRVADAAVKFDKAMRWNRLNPRFPSATADALRVVQPEDAQVPKLIRRSIALDRNNPYYYLQLARVLMQRPDFTPGGGGEIEVLIRRSLALDPYHMPDAFQALADLYERIGNPTQVERAYRDALMRFGGQGVPQDEVLRFMLWYRIVPLYLNWSSYLILHGRPTEAVSVLESLLAEDPTVSAAYLRVADLHVQAGSYPAADRALTRGLQHIPWDEQLWVRWRTLPARRTPIYER